jgi:hypothetical protein
MARLTDARNLPEDIEVMARPKRFELLTPRFVVWCHALMALSAPLAEIFRTNLCSHFLCGQQ